MNDVLGLEFIKLFHEQTSHLEEEGPRLLHVDCHSSHINLPLLQFARAHNIIIFGYPPHTTHLLQGLDVVLFSPFKNAYAKHAAQHLKEAGDEVNKSAFLSVLHRAVQDSFTEKNILMAWKKTGLRPIDPSVISEADLAPSKEFASVFTLPLPPPSPIRAVINAIHGQYALNDPHRLSAAAAMLTLNTNLQCSHQTASIANDQHCSHVSINHATPITTSVPPSTSHPNPIFPQLSSSAFQDPLNLLTTQVESLTLDATSPFSTHRISVPPDMELAPNPPTDLTDNTNATYVAGEILRGLATTRLAPLLELETVTSSCELPPIERGPLPKDLVQAVQSSGSLPSHELWKAVQLAFPHLLSRADHLLAQTVLQEVYCQRLQRTLKLKEKPKNQTNLKKVMGFGEGLIFTSDRIYEALEETAKVKEKEQDEIQTKKDSKVLEREAKEWKEAAIARQAAAHAAVIEEWKAKPASERSRRQPAKPRLEPVPEEYKEALKPKKRQPRKRRGSSSSEFSSSSA